MDNESTSNTTSFLVALLLTAMIATVEALGGDVQTLGADLMVVNGRAADLSCYDKK